MLYFYLFLEKNMAKLLKNDKKMSNIAICFAFQTNKNGL